MKKLKSLSITARDALAEAIRSGQVVAQPELISARLSLCFSCPDNVRGTCQQCGCALKFKTMLVASKCPVGNW